MPIPAIPVVLVVGGSALTLKSDTKVPELIYNRPNGTVYWGGAGLNGSYINSKLAAFKNAGIKDVFTVTEDTMRKDLIIDWLGTKIGAQLDAARSGTYLRYNSHHDYMVKVPQNTSKQFNLIGYSYGSLLAAQTAYDYASHGHIVNHLILIASPISADFLNTLRSHKNIKKTHILNLTHVGDPIYAGMPWTELVSCTSILGKQEKNKKGEGHFYYGHDIPETAARQKDLAQQIKNFGLE